MAMSLASPYRKGEQGLTLIEVLIALVIISIAMTAVIKTATQNIQSTRYLQEKTIALWVGQQVMNEARADLLHLGKSSGNQRLTTEIFGRDWFWQLDEEETPIKEIKKISVKVFQTESQEEADSPIITLESYRYDKKMQE